MLARPFRALAGASLALSLIACGDDEGGGGGTEPLTTFPAALVETFGATGEILGEYAYRAMDFDGANVSLAPGAPGASRDPQQLVARVLALASLRGGVQFAPGFTTSPTCTPTTTGAATDTDADGIPDEMTIEYTAANCTVTDTATGDVQVQRGFIRYRDTSDDLYGFEMDITELRQDSYDGTTGTWSRQTVRILERARTTASGATWSLILDADIKSGTEDTVDVQQVVRYDVEGTYTSNGAVPAGGPMPDGTITLSGSLEATLPQYGRMVMSLVTPPTRPITSRAAPTSMMAPSRCGSMGMPPRESSAPVDLLRVRQLGVPRERDAVGSR